MSWVERILPHIRTRGENSPKDSAVPEGVWTKCPSCGQPLYTEELVREMYVCPKCSCHMRMRARERLERFLDADEQEELFSDIAASDPLQFSDSKPYPERVKTSQAKTGEKDAFIVMKGKLDGRPVICAAFDFSFMGGSMGSAVGEKFTRAALACATKKIPYIVFTASGGARMQEGLFSLYQMGKTVSVLHKLSENKVPFISVLTDPTMGGVSASFAFLGDVVIAEPNALIGFAGPRVIEQTVRQKLPEGFQRSEMLFKKGAIDMICERRRLRTVISRIISHLA